MDTFVAVMEKGSLVCMARTYMKGREHETSLIRQVSGAFSDGPAATFQQYEGTWSWMREDGPPILKDPKGGFRRVMIDAVQFATPYVFWPIPVVSGKYASSCWIIEGLKSCDEAFVESTQDKLGWQTAIFFRLVNEKGEPTKSFALRGEPGPAAKIAVGPTDTFEVGRKTLRSEPRCCYCGRGVPLDKSHDHRAVSVDTHYEVVMLMSNSAPL
jgi:hypothetical protein